MDSPAFRRPARRPDRLATLAHAAFDAGPPGAVPRSFRARLRAFVAVLRSHARRHRLRRSPETVRVLARAVAEAAERGEIAPVRRPRRTARSLLDAATVALRVVPRPGQTDAVADALVSLLQSDPSR